ncbi:MAG: hypothetical protein ACR2RL_11690 [Gammaproteobacteria bacterium]
MAAAARRYEQRMCEHLAAVAPGHTRIMGPAALAAFVSAARQRAKDNGVTQQETTRAWLEISLLLGYRFDDDPQYPWVTEALGQSGNEVDRMCELHRKVVDYIEQTHGPQDALYLHRLRRLKALSGRLHEAKDAEHARSVVVWAYGEKCAAAGIVGLDELMKRARRSAEVRGFAEGAGTLTMALLALFLGHGHADDPQYPWLAGVLADDPGRAQTNLETLLTTMKHNLLAASQEHADG